MDTIRTHLNTKRPFKLAEASRGNRSHGPCMTDLAGQRGGPSSWWAAWRGFDMQLTEHSVLNCIAHMHLMFSSRHPKEVATFRWALGVSLASQLEFWPIPQALGVEIARCFA